MIERETMTIELTEYVTEEIASELLPAELGEQLWREYGDRIAVEFPSPRSRDRWRLTSQGWVGMIPLAPELTILLEPKVPLSNLFRMLEYAYRLRSFRFLDGIYECGSLQEFYSELAGLLARRMLDRARRGLYQEYVEASEQLPYLRGSLDVRRMASAPASASLHCDYQESTVDIDDNRIVAQALSLVARSGLCSERVLPTVRRAHHALHGAITQMHLPPSLCIGRSYNRLNEDYHPLHALSRFFLEHCGPTHERGDREMIPFLIDMARLFELFVAEWLAAHLPERIMLLPQEIISFSGAAPLRFTVDILLAERATGRALIVADTKYKLVRSPAASDVAQIVAYAEATGCREAFLIYPAPLESPLDIIVGEIHVRSVAFRLDGDLESAGDEVMRVLIDAG